MLPNPGCADILPTRSNVSEEDSRLEERLPGAGRDGLAEEGKSAGRRPLRRDMFRDWGSLGGVVRRGSGMGEEWVVTVVVRLCV